MPIEKRFSIVFVSIKYKQINIHYCIDLTMTVFFIYIILGFLTFGVIVDSVLDLVCTLRSKFKMFKNARYFSK